MSTLFENQEALWLGALAAAPVAVLVAALCRGVQRPGTRHMLWCLALLAFVVPGVLLASGWMTAIDGAVREVPRAIVSAFPPERASEAGRDRATGSPSLASDLSDAPIALDHWTESRIGRAASPSPLAGDAPPDLGLEAGDWPSVAPGTGDGLEEAGLPASWLAGRNGAASELAGSASTRADAARRLATKPGGEPRVAPLGAWPDSSGRSSTHEMIADRGPSSPTGAMRPGEAGLPESAPGPARAAGHATAPDRSGVRPPAVLGSDADRRPLPAGPRSGAMEQVEPGGLAAPIAGVEPRAHDGLDLSATSGAAPAPRPLGTRVAATVSEAARGPAAPDIVPGLGPVIEDPIWRGLASAGSAVTRWAEAIGEATASVLRVPSPPAPVWVSGIVLIVVVGGARAMAGRASVRRVQPVDRSDRRLVEALSDRLGLRRAPRAYLVRARISPMVCGWLNPRIVLPEGLWRSLDMDGRRAVLTHELAHLQRRDQWVRLVELAIGVVYWWHPVLWAVRRRIREEADLCCDAWVTTLFPGLRRSYAEALLRTRVYLSIPGAVAPVAGLGMASARSRRFSRRLTMVMTGQNRAKASPLGVALAVAVGTVTLVVAPSLAHSSLKKGDRCPPESAGTAAASVGGHDAHAVSTASGPTSGGHAGTLTLSARELVPQLEGGSCCAGTASPTSATTPAGGVATGGLSTSVSHGVGIASAPTARVASPFAGAAPGHPTAASVYADTAHTVYAGEMAHADAGSIEDRLSRLESRLNRLDASIQRLLDRMEGTPARAAAGVSPLGVSRSLLNQPEMELVSPGLDAVSWRSYALPEGKRDALWELMSRDDVPIYVRVEDDGIALQGTPAQQEVFARFLALINPDGGEAYAEAFGSADAWLSDPFFSQGGASAGPAGAAEVEAQARRNAVAARERAMGDYRRTAEAMERRAVDAENRAAEMEARAEAARNDQQRERLEAQAEAMREQAEAMREQAEEMRAALDEARAEMEEAMSDMESEQADARAEMERAMVELRAQLASAHDQAGEEAENCACTGECAGEHCADDCDDDCHCRAGAAGPAVAAPAVPARPARAAAPARAPRPQRD